MAHARLRAQLRAQARGWRESAVAQGRGGGSGLSERPLSVLSLALSLSLSPSLLLCACGESAQQQVSLPLFAQADGERVAGLSAVEGEVAGTLELTEAKLAFGPLYICAGAQAGELCEVARLEWLESAVIDALRSERVELGALSGVSGQVSSWMYDLGLSSQLTQDNPFVLEAAQALNGASAQLAWRWLSAEGEPIASFVASIKVQQGEGTERGVPVVRKSVSERFGGEVSGDEEGVLVRLTPSRWLASLSLARALQEVRCEGAPLDELEPPALSAPLEELKRYAQRCEGVWRVKAESLTERALTLSISSSARPTLLLLP